MARLMTLLDLAGEARAVLDLKRAGIGADFEDEVPIPAVGADLLQDADSPQVAADIGTIDPSVAADLDPSVAADLGPDI